MYVRLVMSVVLFSVRVALGDDCHSSGMLRQQYDTSAVVSARAHGFYSALYHILTSSFRRVTFYGLSLLVRTRNALQNELTMLSARAHLN